MSKSAIAFVTQNYTSLSGMKVPPKYPPKLRLLQLRKERGLSMEKLAGMIGREKPLIYKLEKGLTRYNETVLNALAKALEVSPMELLSDEEDHGSGAPPGLAEDAHPFDLRLGTEGLPLLGPQEFVYEVSTRVLDQINILPGDRLVINMADGFLNRLQDGDVVIAQVYSDAAGANATTILRQFLSPSLLVSNSGLDNPKPINTRSEDATIKGVMTSSHRIKSRPSRH